MAIDFVKCGAMSCQVMLGYETAFSSWYELHRRRKCSTVSTDRHIQEVMGPRSKVRSAAWSSALLTCDRWTLEFGKHEPRVPFESEHDAGAFVFNSDVAHKVSTGTHYYGWSCNNISDSWKCIQIMMGLMLYLRLRSLCRCAAHQTSLNSFYIRLVGFTKAKQTRTSFDATGLCQGL
jgi:hypothetical protein